MSYPVNYGNGLIKEVQMQEDEVIFVNNLIQFYNEPKYFEWGSGGSTIHFLKQNPKLHISSVEHNKEWYDKVLSVAIDEDVYNRMNYRFVSEEHGTNHGYATPTEEHPIGLKHYIRSIYQQDRIPDIIMIDGIARAACAMSTLLHCREYNYQPRIFIHDFVGREPWYDWCLPYYRDVVQVGSTLVELIL